MKELPKTYDPGDSEDEIYKKWESSGFFNPDKLEGGNDRFWKAEVFSMMMPPPNATGELHIGHAMISAARNYCGVSMDLAGKPGVASNSKSAKWALPVTGLGNATLCPQNYLCR